ncbi:FHA domain-containing protein [Moorena sp. SIO4G3]|uniref:FHA domain-containing protein n=1 Tax=Moorena sp. SIO4G3 TaxID=2607821 RepID=UPI0025D32381|nr:FHA domain-containing protein [Moorena sp. SIO4G3]
MLSKIQHSPLTYSALIHDVLVSRSEILAEPIYIQLTWEDPETGELKKPVLRPPIAVGRENDHLPEQLAGQSVSHLVLLDKEISRYHALITVANTQLYITDRSANGTFINGRKIRSGIHPFSSKDTLRIGPYKITATLKRENDLNATVQNFDQTNLLGEKNVSNSLPKNKPVVWLIGLVILLIMGVGTWAVVSGLLEGLKPIPNEENDSSRHHLERVV